MRKLFDVNIVALEADLSVVRQLREMLMKPMVMDNDAYGGSRTVMQVAYVERRRILQDTREIWGCFLGE